MISSRRRSAFLRALAFSLFLPWSRAALSCSSDVECSAKLREGSFCVDGFCSNPFVQGCLKTLKSEHTAGRVCNSDDKKAGSTDCYHDEFHYPEIRIHNGNWESSIFFAWILQILLMEVLNVPATVGLTTATTAESGFYSPTNILAYSAKAYPFEALRDAGACHETDEECAHFMPEVWNGQLNEWTAALNEGYIDPLEGNGQVGKGSWYVPTFSAARDESLVSFYGLRGEENRQKLANDFLRPTSWGEYCEKVSLTNCSSPDLTAQSYPNDDQQASRYFAPPEYIGHFRLTEENNCTINPDTCMGHIVGPSCTWSTNIDAQLYWNNIKLKPDGPIEPNGGYSYQALIEIWRAANETKSNLLLWWWRPEALVEEFYGTDAQFQQVLLPEATDICSRARVSTEDRCSLDIMERRGDPDGACDQEAHALQKVFSKAFAEAAEEASPAMRSPGYDLLKAIKITDLEINNMLRRWISGKTDPYGNDAREAVCTWVVDNFDILMDFMPPGYPKELSEESSYDTGFLHAATALAIFSTLVVLGTAVLALLFRKTKVFTYAQSHIVFLILLGFLLITIASILTTLEPSDPICVAQNWLVILGYTIELVPLLVKIAAINKILSSAKKMRRVQISRNGMLYNVGFIVFFVVAYLTIWTIIDPPLKVEQRVLPYENSAIIETSLTCTSDKDFWVAVALGWQSLLLLMATVLAFQSRDIIQEFNESRSLGTMIYSHLLFLAMRGILYNLRIQEIFRPNVVAAVTSCLLSLDTLIAICIYLLPKCIEAKVSPNGPTESKRNSIQARSSIAVTEIEARAMAARTSHFLSGAFGEEADSSLRDPRNSTIVSALRVNHGGSMQRSSTIFSGIPEEPSESESDDQAKKCAIDCRLSPGSFRTDHSGSIIRTPPRKNSRQGSLIRLARQFSGERGLSLKKRNSGDSSRKLQTSGSVEADDTEAPLRKMPSTKAASLLLTQLNEQEASDDDLSDDDFDIGGPRFANRKVDEQLERSIRMQSAHNLAASLTDDDPYESTDSKDLPEFPGLHLTTPDDSNREVRETGDSAGESHAPPCSQHRSITRI